MPLSRLGTAFIPASFIVASHVMIALVGGLRPSGLAWQGRLEWQRYQSANLLVLQQEEGRTLTMAAFSNFRQRSMAVIRVNDADWASWWSLEAGSSG